MGATEVTTPIVARFPHLSPADFKKLARAVRAVPDIEGLDERTLTIDTPGKTIRLEGIWEGEADTVLDPLLHLLAEHLSGGQRLLVESYFNGEGFLGEGEHRRWLVEKGRVTEERMEVLPAGWRLVHELGADGRWEAHRPETARDDIERTIRVLERAIERQRASLGYLSSYEKAAEKKRELERLQPELLPVPTKKNATTRGGPAAPARSPRSARGPQPRGAARAGSAAAAGKPKKRGASRARSR